jgi:hypothetical protein
MGPYAGTDAPAVHQRRGALEIGPQRVLAADVADADPPRLLVVLAGDAAAVLVHRVVGTVVEHPGLEREGAGGIERGGVGDLHVAVRRGVARC